MGGLATPAPQRRRTPTASDFSRCKAIARCDNRSGPSRGEPDEHCRRTDGEPGGSPSSELADLKLEVVVIPVADADRSKAFYAGLGWRLDADFSFDNGFRVVQFTPPGSPCSVQFGTKITGAPPGSAHGLYLIVSDIDAGRDELVSRGAKVSEVFHSGAPGAQLDPRGGWSGQRSGSGSQELQLLCDVRRPGRQRLAAPEVTDRLPGRLDPTTTSFNSAGDLAAALRRAESAHGEHEKRIGKADPDWPDWYAEYMVGEQTGQELPRERFRRDRARRRRARRALRGRHRGAGLSGRGRRAGAGRRRVLVLGVHPVQVSLAPGEAVQGARDVDASAQVNVQATLDWRDYMVSDYSDAGQERWLADRGIDLIRGVGRLAGPGVVEVDGTRHTAEHVVVATGSDPVVPPIPGLDGLDGVWGTREATAMKTIPRRLIVLGGGSAGVEIAQVVRRLGGEAVLVEGADRVIPREPAPWARRSPRHCGGTGSSCASECRPPRPCGTGTTTS